MQTDGGSGQAGQRDVDIRAGRNRELEPLFLVHIGDVLRNRRATFDGLGLHPIEVGGCDGAAIRELGGAIFTGGSGAYATRFDHATVEGLVKDGNAVRIGGDIDGADKGAAFAKVGGVAVLVGIHIDGVVLIRRTVQFPAHPGGAAIGGGNGEHREVLIAIGPVDDALMVESESITGQVDAQPVVGVKAVAADGGARPVSDQHTNPVIEGDDITVTFFHAADDIV